MKILKINLNFLNFLNINEVPIVIIEEEGLIEIYNGFNFLKENKTLEYIGDKNKLNDFEYFKLVTGKTWSEYEKELSHKNRVDYKLIENIKVTREILTTTYGIDDTVANSLLGKSIFTRYLIDRKVRIGFDSSPREWTNSDFCRVLSSKKITLEFFKYLDNTFKGDLFPFNDNYGHNVQPEALQVIIDLLNGNELIKQWSIIII